MTNQVIPAEAVEALMDAASDSGFVLKRSQAHDWLEAAAPYMLRAAWDEGWEAHGDWGGPTRNPYMLNNEGEK